MSTVSLHPKQGQVRGGDLMLNVYGEVTHRHRDNAEAEINRLNDAASEGG